MEFFIYISCLDVASDEAKKGINPNFAFSMGFHDDCLKIFSPDGKEFWANDDGTISLGNPLRRQAQCVDQIEAQTIEAMETTQNETQTIEAMETSQNETQTIEAMETTQHETQTLDCWETESSGPKSCWNVHKRHER